MLQKIIITFVFVSTMALTSYSKDHQWFQPKITLLTGYTFMENNTQISSGNFDIMNRKFGYGFSFTNKFYIHEDYFLNTGFQYYNYQSVVEGLNPFPNRFDHPSPFTWEKGYNSLTIPVHFGKDFYSSGRSIAEVFIGASFGVLTTSFEKGKVTSSNTKEYNMDLISAESKGTSELPNSFYLAGNMGVIFEPFKSLPNLGIGVLFTLQINKTSFESNFQGITRNETKNEVYPYQMQLNQKFSNCSFLISYTFNQKNQSGKKVNSLNCIR